MRVDSSWYTDQSRSRELIKRSWSTSWVRLVRCGAVVAALTGAPLAQAGFIVLTAEWMSVFDPPARPADSSGSIEEISQAMRSFTGGDFDGCLKQLGQAVKTHPELPPPHALFASLAIEGRQASLIRPALEQAVLEDPEHPEVFILFGKLALMEGRLTDAAVQFDKATMLASSSRWTDAKRRGLEPLCLQGQCSVAESRGDWKAARAALDRWLKLEPESALARQRLGNALFHLGQQKAAYQELQQAATADPTLEPAAITMGRLYTGAGDRKQAQEWMDYAVKAAPDSPAVRIGLADWMLEQGRADEALAHADAAERLDPKSRAARRLLGLAARARKDFARAEPIFQALVQESPGDAWVRNQLAMALAEQADEDKHRRALELAELSLRQAPDAPDALATLGTVYYHLHRLDDAEKVLREVVGSGRGSSDAAYILARVKADRGRPDATLALLKAALESPGIFISRIEARQWFDRLAMASKSTPSR